MNASPPTSPQPGDVPLALLDVLMNDQRIGFVALGVMTYVLSLTGMGMPVYLANVARPSGSEWADGVQELLTAGYLSEIDGELHVVEEKLT